MSFFDFSRTARTRSTDGRRVGRVGVSALLAGLLLGGVLLAPAAAAAPVTEAPATEAPAADAPTTSADAPDAPVVENTLDQAPTSPDEVSWGVGPATANGPDGRTRYDYTLSPGESVEDWFSVSNFSTTPLVMHVYAQDAITTEDGSYSLPPAASASKEVGAWVGITRMGDVEEYTIEPGQRLDIPFRLSVPKNASPGEYFGGIVAAPAEPEAQANADGSVVAVDRRVGTRIYLNVPGARKPAMTITEPVITYDAGFNPVAGDATVRYTVKNPGNVMVSGTTELTLTGPFGITLKTLDPVEFKDLLPGAEVVHEEALEGVFPALRITASVTLTPQRTSGPVDPTLPQVTMESTVWAVPWIIVGVLVLVILLVALLVMKSRRTKKKIKALQAAAAGAVAAATPAAPAGEGSGSDGSA